MKNCFYVLTSFVCAIVLFAGCGSETVDDREFLEEVRESSEAATAEASEAGLIEPGNASPPLIELATAQFEMGLIPDEGFTFKEMPIYNRGGSPFRSP